jgi:hypothetical protein
MSNTPLQKTDSGRSSDSGDEAVSEIEAPGVIFTLFPKLTPELRCKVWQYAIPAGRVVDIVYDEDQDHYFSFHAKIPAVLHVCFESREIALKIYDLCFGTKTHATAIPFDFKRDCFMLDDWLAARFQGPHMDGGWHS